MPGALPKQCLPISRLSQVIATVTAIPTARQTETGMPWSAPQAAASSSMRQSPNRRRNSLSMMKHRAPTFYAISINKEIFLMSVSTTKYTISIDRTKQQDHYPRWQTMLFWGVILALVVVAVGMRLYQLGVPFDRDGYDEGVYWQTLRAMSAGHALYGDIFYSQPPFFILSTFPGYILLGGSLWSARFAIALVSLFGLLGAALLGKALAGRLGAVAALLLLVVNPLYLAESQTIQAEASSTAFTLLAVGLAYLWWEHPAGKR